MFDLKSVAHVRVLFSIEVAIGNKSPWVLSTRGYKNTRLIKGGVRVIAFTGRIDSIESSTLLCLAKQVGFGLPQLLMWLHCKPDVLCCQRSLCFRLRWKWHKADWFCEHEPLQCSSQVV